MIPSNAIRTASVPYPLDNQHSQGGAHLDSLADLLDPFTKSRIAGLGEWRGASVLEVGAGSGSVALWIADKLGDRGLVIATDKKPDFIRPHPRLRVLQHDLTSNERLPEGPYDLIHARLVLGHLPQRELVLRRLCGYLRPGGTILLEEWARLRTRAELVMVAPTEEIATLYGRCQEAVRDIFDAHGTDRGWARSMHADLLAEGLRDVQTEIHARYWVGGDAGCRMVGATIEQLRPRLVERGLTELELDQLASLLMDRRLVVHGHPLYSTSGRRPG
jgi:SAM-dependent methyltransferase